MSLLDSLAHARANVRRLESLVAQAQAEDDERAARDDDAPSFVDSSAFEYLLGDLESARETVALIVEAMADGGDCSVDRRGEPDVIALRQ